MSKSAEEIREELARRKRERQERIVTANENGQCSMPVVGQVVRRLSKRQVHPQLLSVAGRATLPHSVEAEKGILCAMLQRPARASSHATVPVT